MPNNEGHINRDGGYCHAPAPAGQTGNCGYHRGHHGPHQWGKAMTTAAGGMTLVEAREVRDRITHHYVQVQIITIGPMLARRRVLRCWYSLEERAQRDGLMLVEITDQSHARATHPEDFVA